MKDFFEKIQFRLKLEKIMMHRSQIFPIIILLSLTVITRLLLITIVPNVYNIDAYTYIYKATGLALTGKINLAIGIPFEVFLGIFIKIGFTFGIDAITASRICMLLISCLLVSILYLLGVKLSGRLFGFSAALLMIFEPYFISYSIVPYTDVFAVTLALCAIYFALSNNWHRYILVPIFFYLTVATRAEFYPSLVIPILFLYFYKLGKINSKKTILLGMLALVIYILPALWIYPRAVLGRFSIFQRFSLFLKPDSLKITLYDSFGQFNQPILNIIIFFLITAGICLALVNLFKPKISTQRTGERLKISRKNFIKSEGLILGLSLGLFFILHVIVLTVYGFGYEVIGNTVQIASTLPERYLILPSLLLIYPLVYPLTFIIKKIYRK
jgi:hypothetical protein